LQNQTGRNISSGEFCLSCWQDRTLPNGGGEPIINHNSKLLKQSVISNPASQQERKKKILFVDDEPDMTIMLKIALERIGFTIDIFNDPVLVLKNFRPNLYDFIILDVMMPKMDGVKLYNQLKNADPGIKVCFLTASSEMYHEELRKERYCVLDKDLFLHKPLPIKGIREEIRKRIGS
jgi:CheY-like chemotaxis protein